MFARTERLLLRPAWAEDGDALFRGIADERVVRNLATAPWPYLPEHAEGWIRMDRPASMPAALIFLRTGGAPELVGGIGIHASGDEGHELGYWIARRHWGFGYATEAGEAMIAFARQCLRLREIVAGHFLDNPASGSVLRKLGFQPSGAIRMRHSVARGEDAPMAEFVLQLSRNAEQSDLTPAAVLAA